LVRNVQRAADTILDVNADGLFVMNVRLALVNDWNGQPPYKRLTGYIVSGHAKCCS